MTRQTWLVASALGLATAAAAYLLVWPIYVGFNGTNETRATLLQVNGGWAVVPVAFPVVVAVSPLAFRKQAVRIGAAVVMCAFALVAVSIGLFYVPSAMLMVVAACVPGSSVPEVSR